MDNLVKWAVVLGAGCILIAAHMHDAKADSLPLAVQIIACESAGRADVWGDDHKSFGIAQFQRSTFQEMSRHAGTDGEWRTPYDQLQLLKWALRHGKGRYWTCYRKIRAGTWHISRALDRKMRRSLLINEVFGGSA